MGDTDKKNTALFEALHQADTIAKENPVVSNNADTMNGEYATDVSHKNQALFEALKKNKDNDTVEVSEEDIDIIELLLFMEEKGIIEILEVEPEVIEQAYIQFKTEPKVSEKEQEYVSQLWNYSDEVYNILKRYEGTDNVADNITVKDYNELIEACTMLAIPDEDQDNVIYSALGVL